MKDRILELRKKMGLTLDEFGKRIGVSAAAVSLYEKGKREPMATTITVICNEFHISRKWLVEGEGEMFNISSEINSIENLIEALHCSEEEAQFLRLYFAMSEPNRKNFYNYLKMLENMLHSMLDTLIESKK